MTRGAAVAATLATARGPLPARGVAATAVVFSPGGVAWDDDGIVTFVGDADDLPSEPVTLGRVDEGTIVPGFVDCHVHLPFVGWRADEFEARLAGVSYRDLHGEEGGIYRSARMLAEADDDEVLSFSKALTLEMAALGTTATELKTGYGLSIEGELRQLRLARRLAEAAAQTCRVTLLACHAVPEGRSRDDWVRAACEELLPAAAAEGLADAVDIYVEDIAFSLDDLQRVGTAASAAGLPLRVHADQLGESGAAEAAAALGARSADHLNHVSDAGIAALGEGATAAVLLPASTFTLRAAPAPVAA
ncbi:MAG: imidazolonepropionase, partial [Actinomycetia bacterium]|nr:imidazolonepropionase [Actinomycetes bacterium]